MLKATDVKVRKLGEARELAGLFILTIMNYISMLSTYQQLGCS